MDVWLCYKGSNNKNTFLHISFNYLFIIIYYLTKIYFKMHQISYKEKVGSFQNPTGSFFCELLQINFLIILNTFSRNINRQILDNND